MLSTHLGTRDGHTCQHPVRTATPQSLTKVAVQWTDHAEIHTAGLECSCRPFMSTAKWRLQWTATTSRNEHERFFLSTRRDKLHSLTYITMGRRHVCPELHAIAMQNSCINVPIIKFTRVAQYIGEVILAQLEDNRQTLRERRSNLWHPTVFLLEQAVHDVRRRHFWTIPPSPRHVFAHAHGPRSDRDPRSSREICAQVTPRRRTKEPLS